MHTKPASKHDRIIDAARTVFLDAGYAGASMDRIAGRAGVSKQTVYNHFGSKADLFAAMVRRRCDEMTDTLVMPASGDPAEVLRKLARVFMDITLAADAIALYRTILCESVRSPELGAAFYQAGPERFAAALAGYLHSQAFFGKIGQRQAHLLAEQFLAMLHGNLQTRALLGLKTPPGSAQLDDYVEQAVAMLMAVCGNR